MGGGFALMTNSLMSKKHRLDLWRSYGSMFMMLPQGANLIWEVPPVRRLDNRSLTWSESMSLLRSDSMDDVPSDIARLATWLHQGIKAHHPPDQSTRSDDQKFASRSTNIATVDGIYWPNPLASVLPFAPDMKLWAIYGQGIQTEVSTDFVTNLDSNEPKYAPVSGTYLTVDGDGSVPIHSLGFMCAHGWKLRERNRARVPCIIREYAHQKPGGSTPSVFSRGGRGQANHVDILGNPELIEDIIKIALGPGIEQRIHSDIMQVPSHKSSQQNVNQEL